MKLRGNGIGARGIAPAGGTQEGCSRKTGVAARRLDPPRLRAVRRGFPSCPMIMPPAPFRPAAGATAPARCWRCIARWPIPAHGRGSRSRWRRDTYRLGSPRPCRNDGWDGMQDFHALATARSDRPCAASGGGRADRPGRPQFRRHRRAAHRVGEPQPRPQPDAGEPVLFAAARETPAYAEMSRSPVDLPALIARDRERPPPGSTPNGRRRGAVGSARRQRPSQPHPPVPAADSAGAGQRPDAAARRLEGLDMPVLLVEGRKVTPSSARSMTLWPCACRGCRGW